MRKIIEASPVSVDGVVGDAQLRAMDYRDEEVQQEALDRLASADAMLMGRGTYEVFAATWPGQSGAFDRPHSPAHNGGTACLSSCWAGCPGVPVSRSGCAVRT